MIYIKELDFTIKNPNEELPLNIKKYLYENLKRGFVFFIFPSDFNSNEQNIKKLKKTYKVGFIYDMLTTIYPNFGKEQKSYIISDEFQMLFTYRQFKTILDDYEKNRNKYLLKRSLLCT